jgi:hypothetical protein
MAWCAALGGGATGPDHHTEISYVTLAYSP